MSQGLMCVQTRDDSGNITGDTSVVKDVVLVRWVLGDW